jgi:hypothetical protein
MCGGGPCSGSTNRRSGRRVGSALSRSQCAQVTIAARTSRDRERRGRDRSVVKSRSQWTGVAIAARTSRDRERRGRDRSVVKSRSQWTGVAIAARTSRDRERRGRDRIVVKSRSRAQESRSRWAAVAIPVGCSHDPGGLQSRSQRAGVASIGCGVARHARDVTGPVGATGGVELLAGRTSRVSPGVDRRARHAAHAGRAQARERLAGGAGVGGGVRGRGQLAGPAIAAGSEAERKQK